MDDLYRLGDVFTLIGGGTPSTNNEKYWGKGTPWISSADISDRGTITYRRKVTAEGIRCSTTNVVPCGSVVVVTRVGLGKVALLKEKMCFSQDIQGLVPKSKELKFNPLFLQYQLSQIMQHLKYQGQGTTISGITKKKLCDVKLFLPSIEVQDHIVSHIEELFSELDNGVETLRKTKQQLAVYRQAVLKDAFSGCDKQASVSSVCAHVTDGDHMPPPKAASGIPFIMISNIDGNRIDFSDTAFVGRDYYENIDSKRRPQVGDVLYSVTGSFGIPVLVDFEKEFCFQRHIALLRPNDSILSRYLYYAMQAPDVYAQASKGATGTAQKTVGLTVLRKILIPYTEDKTEQEQIVREVENKMSVCDSIEKTVDTALQQAEAMRQSILKQVLEGKI